MSKILAFLKSIYLNPTVRHDAKHLVIVIAGVIAAHFGLKLN